MFTRSDEYLLAGDKKRAILLGLGASRTRTDIGSRLRLGQTHGSGPLSGDHSLTESIPKWLRPVILDQLRRPARQERHQVEGQVRAEKDIVHYSAYDFRQPESAELGITSAPQPSSVDVLPPSTLDR